MFNSKYNSVLVVLIIILKLTSAIEPRCSTYEYDEKILERLVRTEFKFDNAMTAIEAAVGNVAKGLASLDEERMSFKSEIDSFKQQVRDVVREVKLDINETLSLKTAELEDVVKQQQAIITRMASDLTELRNQTIDDIKSKLCFICSCYKATIKVTSHHINLTLRKRNNAYKICIRSAI